MIEYLGQRWRSISDQGDCSLPKKFRGTKRTCIAKAVCGVVVCNFIITNADPLTSQHQTRKHQPRTWHLEISTSFAQISSASTPAKFWRPHRSFRLANPSFYPTPSTMLLPGHFPGGKYNPKIYRPLAFQQNGGNPQPFNVARFLRNCEQAEAKGNASWLNAEIQR